MYVINDGDTNVRVFKFKKDNPDKVLISVAAKHSNKGADFWLSDEKAVELGKALIHHATPPETEPKYVNPKDCTCKSWGCDKCCTPEELRRRQGIFS